MAAKTLFVEGPEKGAESTQYGVLRRRKVLNCSGLKYPPTTPGQRAVFDRGHEKEGGKD